MMEEAVARRYFFRRDRQEGVFMKPGVLVADLLGRQGEEDLTGPAVGKRTAEKIEQKKKGVLPCVSTAFDSVNHTYMALRP